MTALVPSSSRAPRLWRGAFAGYASVLFLATHWPRLQIHAPVPRPDLYIHVAAFGLWTLLCGLCAWFGARWSGVNIASTGLVALLYAAIDEGTQAFPFLGRTAALDDYAANALGVVLGVCILWVAGLRATARSKSVLACPSPDTQRKCGQHG